MPMLRCRRPRVLRATGVLALGLAGMTSEGRSQTGSIVGAVMRDSLGHEIAGADASILALKRTAQANFLGVFRFDEVPAGKHLVQVRAIGFQPAMDTLVVVAGHETQHEFILSTQPKTLDSVKVIAAGASRYISPALRGFEERQKQGFGHFINEDDLRKGENRTLANLLLGRIPGVYPVSEDLATYLSSGRSSGSGGPVLKQGGRASASAASAGGSQKSAIKVRGCWITFFVDGVRIYDATMTERDSSYRPPDAGRMDVRDYAGIEYYAGGATIPPQFNSTGSSCGTLLLWTRER
jgi:Carboxypeptidase regulatory-like domain/TonB-dependent Receptor Plug Domain